MGALFLMLTIITESTAIIFMKLSDGFHNKWQAVVAVICYILSFIFITLALKHLPVGLANAIWAGASTLLVVLLGVFIFREQLSTLQFIFLTMVVIGLVGLNVTGKD